MLSLASALYRATQPTYPQPIPLDYDEEENAGFYSGRRLAVTTTVDAADAEEYIDHVGRAGAAMNSAESVGSADVDGDHDDEGCWEEEDDDDFGSISLLELINTNLILQHDDVSHVSHSGGADGGGTGGSYDEEDGRKKKNRKKKKKSRGGKKNMALSLSLDNDVPPPGGLYHPAETVVDPLTGDVYEGPVIQFPTRGGGEDNNNNNNRDDDENNERERYYGAAAGGDNITDGSSPTTSIVTSGTISRAANNVIRHGDDATLTSNDGLTRFCGRYTNDHPHEGTLVTPTFTYTGSLDRRGKFTRYGHYVHCSGREYEGEFWGGRYHGAGKEVRPHEEENDDDEDGMVRMRRGGMGSSAASSTLSPPRSSSRGDNNKKHGHHGGGGSAAGTVVVTYTGNYVRGMKHGLGTLVRTRTVRGAADARRYGLKYGNINDERRVGDDEDVSVVEYSYTGSWKDDLREGEGTEIFAPGCIPDTAASAAAAAIRRQQQQQPNKNTGRRGKGGGAGDGGGEGRTNGINAATTGEGNNDNQDDDLDDDDDMSDAVVSYRGQFFRDKRHGRGTLITAGGTQREGTFRAGTTMDGPGWRITYPDGTVYRGEVRDGFPHGRGTICYGSPKTSFSSSDRANAAAVSAVSVVVAAASSSSSSSSPKTSSPATTPSRKKKISGQQQADAAAGGKGMNVIPLLTQRDGSVTYTGDFRFGLRHGRGVCRHAITREEYDGLWMDDEPLMIKSNSPERVKHLSSSSDSSWTKNDTSGGGVGGGSSSSSSSSIMHQASSVLSMLQKGDDAVRDMKKMEEESMSFDGGDGISGVGLDGKKKKKRKKKKTLDDILNDRESEDEEDEDDPWIQTEDENDRSPSVLGGANTGGLRGESLQPQHDTSREQAASGSSVSNSSSHLLTHQYPNGDTFVGQLDANGLRQGHGTYRCHRSGASYEGPWYQDQRHGSDALLLTTTAKYDGAFQYDRKHGYGTLIYNDSSVYRGEFRENRFHGQGTLVESDGTVYRGDWVEGLQHGTGEIQYADGTVYKGNFREGRRHGTGTSMSFSPSCDMASERGGADDVQYSGSWADNVYHGEGTLYLSPTDLILSMNGRPYEHDGTSQLSAHARHEFSGMFAGGKRSGLGTLTTLFGVTMRGRWMRDQPVDGEWTIKYDDGSKFSGFAKCDGLSEGTNGVLGSTTTRSSVAVVIEVPKPHGFGSMTYKNGDVYTGNFVRGEREGNGVGLFANGDRWSGSWKNDSVDVDGVGELTLADGTVHRFGQVDEDDITPIFQQQKR